MAAIDVESRDASTLLRILAEHLPEREVQVMGSRAHGRAKPFSDLDIVVMGDEPLGLDVLAGLRDAFDESDLPFAVDIVEWASASESFRRVILEQARPFRGPGSNRGQPAAAGSAR